VESFAGESKGVHVRKKAELAKNLRRAKCPGLVWEKKGRNGRVKKKGRTSVVAKGDPRGGGKNEEQENRTREGIPQDPGGNKPTRYLERAFRETEDSSSCQLEKKKKRGTVARKKGVFLNQGGEPRQRRKGDKSLVVNRQRGVEKWEVFIQ